MSRAQLSWQVGLVSMLLLASPLAADDRQEVVPPDNRAAMASRIDTVLAEQWKTAGIEPNALTADGEFLRRVHLDLTGTLPSVAEIRDFLADTAEDKRAKKIDQLLATPMHAQHMANTWLRVLLPDNEADEQVGANSEAFRRWLRDRFAANLRYDNLAADLVMAQSKGNEPGPELFYTSVELKPEELAANTARVFLGVQVHCAQCHDHPYDHWKQRDFWGFAAFFAQVRQQDGMRGNRAQIMDTTEGDVTMPDTEEVIAPKYLGGADLPRISGTRRSQLAIWLASADNPFFARAAVNRVWAHMFGQGLVEPIDNLGAKNAPPPPPLLDELADYFVSTGFDLRDLFAVLARTRAYQLTSQSDNAEDTRGQQFARMMVKRLTAEQVFDSINLATRLRPADVAAPANNAELQGGDPLRAEFLSKFRTPPGVQEFQGSIPQALTLMNGRILAQATDASQQGILAAMDAPFFTDAQRLEVLFLATLSRLPAPAEQEKFSQYIQANADKRQAFGDALWALINSAEFLLNH